MEGDFANKNGWVRRALNPKALRHCMKGIGMDLEQIVLDPWHPGSR